MSESWAGLLKVLKWESFNFAEANNSILSVNVYLRSASFAI